MDPDDFRVLLAQKGQELWRDMPWRTDTRPYYVLVSELMLQQTQVSRVIPKFETFVERFPTVDALAHASLAEVLILWQGLGYNRRAKFLHAAARMIMTEYDGIFPEDEAALRTLPGVGVNTAGALVAYAFNQPAVFVETNIRTVYLHDFFSDDAVVDDAQIKQLLETTLDTSRPREFYWALMDYGSWLKSQGIKTNTRSRHYIKQAPLRGSIREVRGAILKQLSSRALSELELHALVDADARFEPALVGLQKDGLIEEVSGYWRLTR